MLNDPDVILARLTNMEHKMDQLQTEVTEEKSKNGILRQTMTQLQTQNVNLQQTMAQIQTELTEEKTKNVNLRQNIQNMKSK